MTREELNQLEQLKTENPLLQHLLTKMDQEHEAALSFISHIIRDDLTIIRSSSQLMAARSPELPDLTYGENIENAVLHTRRSLDALSEYHNSSKLSCSYFNPNRLLIDAVHSVFREGYSFSASILLQTETSRPDFYGDPEKLYHAFILLLKNSCESFPGENGKIELTLSCMDRFLTISLSDNGNGFSQEMKETLLTPFPTDKQPSSLELCTAHNIILSHGGHIDLAHTEPEGTRMIIYLPLSESGEYK